MLSSAINNLVGDLKSRQRDVLICRFGLADGEKKTLASIGEKYGVTRERVRQLEEDALRTIHDRLAEKEKLINEIKKLVACHLENLGGLRRDDLLIQELKFILKDDNLHHWHLRFFSEVAGQPLYRQNNHNFHNFWYLEKKHFQFADSFVSKLESLIEDKKEEVIIHGKFHDFYIKAVKIHRLPDFVGLNYLSTSKRFGINPFNDFGLSHWEEITPKTIRSKIYLILKKRGEPLHFKDIAKAINKINFSAKKALPQTVHNELIKDPRFVLVGRGIYGLQERGFKPGIAKEVIYRILKEKGPLSSEGVIDLVQKQRFLKNNTIILNLQNKKYFKKLSDGRYCLKI